MNDKNLRYALRDLIEVYTGAIIASSRITDYEVLLIKAAIQKDQEEERNFCKEVVKSKMKPNVQNFAGGK
jgi:hypothetical protein